MAAGAFALAICAAEAAYSTTGAPERYAQFTVGSLTWRDASKRADYFLLLGLVGGFAVAWVSLVAIDQRAERRFGARGALRARAWLGYASLPFIFWVASLLIFQAESLELVHLAAAAVVVIAAGTVLLPALPREGRNGLAMTTWAGAALIAVLFGAFGALIVPFALNRFAVLLTHRLLVEAVIPTHWALAGLIVAATAAAWAGLVPARADRRLAGVLVALQFVAALAFLTIVPSPWSDGARSMYPMPVQRAFLVAGILVAVTYADLVRRLRRSRASMVGPASPLAVVSPLALAAILLFLKQRPVALGILSADDYHFGESLLPWWSLVASHAIPFWDHTPSRGLVDYADGALSALVFDGSAAGVVAGEALLAALALVVGISALGALIGVLAAAVAFIPMPVQDQLGQVDSFNAAVLALLLLWYRTASSPQWLAIWVLGSLAAFLWAPAQGAALVLATSPLACVRLYRAWREGLPRSRTLGLVAAALLVVAVLTPLGKMVIGAARYAVEHSAVAGPAHAVEWALSAGTQGGINRWLWEGVRTSWIVVVLCAIGLVAGTKLRRKRWPRALLVVAVPVVLLGVIFIYRAGGRINPGAITRLGFASVWMLSLLLPVLLYAAWGRGRWPTILALSTFGGGLVAPALAPLDLAAVGGRAVDIISPPSLAFFVDGPREGLPNVGRIGLEPGHVARLRSLQRVLGVLLDGDETYLDLTNRNAHYFYLARRVPIESGAFYNLPNDRQQLRAIDDLARDRVPVVLVSGDAELWDGGPPSFRAYALYRYVLFRYVPVKIAGLGFLVREDRLARLPRVEDMGVDRAGPATLDEAFRVGDLQGLPASWGRSWNTLSAQARPVLTLEGSPRLAPTDGSAAAASAAAPVAWHLSTPLSGRQAGLLTFEFSCPSATGPVQLELSWAPPREAHDQAYAVRFVAAGRVVVPLDAAPRWLLAPKIGVLQVRLLTPQHCSGFSIDAATLWQRSIVDAIDPR